MNNATKKLLIRQKTLYTNKKTLYTNKKFPYTNKDKSLLSFYSVLFCLVVVIVITIKFNLYPRHRIVRYAYVPVGVTECPYGT